MKGNCVLKNEFKKRKRVSTFKDLLEIKFGEFTESLVSLAAIDMKGEHLQESSIFVT